MRRIGVLGAAASAAELPVARVELQSWPSQRRLGIGVSPTAGGTAARPSDRQAQQPGQDQCCHDAEHETDTYDGAIAEAGLHLWRVRRLFAAEEFFAGEKRIVRFEHH